MKGVLKLTKKVALVLTGSWFAASLATLSLGVDGGGSSLVYTAEIRGTINPASSDYLSSAIERATRAGAVALVVELDTPGGLLSSVQEMAQTIDRSTIPVVVHVTPAGAAATSAGALLMLASHHGAMAPGSHIGAAHPVATGGEEIKGPMGEKAVNDTVSFAKGLAEVRGRNTTQAEAIVKSSRSFTAQEAFEKKLIETLATDQAELLEKLHGRQVRFGKNEARAFDTRGARVTAVEMTWGQRILHALAHPNIAALLMTAGLIGIYLEMSNPGIMIPGVLGAISLVVAFMSFQMLPIRVGGVILLALGVIFIIAEAFVASGGMLGIGGALAFVLGLAWIVDPAATDLKVGMVILIPTAIVLGSLGFMVAWAAGRTKKQAHATLAQMGGGAASGLAGYRGLVSAVDPVGHTGKAQVRGEIWDFELAEPGQSVAIGDEVTIVSVQGMRVRVRPSTKERN